MPSIRSLPQSGPQKMQPGDLGERCKLPQRVRQTVLLYIMAWKKSNTETDKREKYYTVINSARKFHRIFYKIQQSLYRTSLNV